MDHTRSGRREVESDERSNQTPIDQLTQVVKGLSSRLEKLGSPSDTLEPHEIVQIRKLLPQIEEIIEGQKRQKWLLKRISAFLLGGPAVLALWQAIKQLVEWIRSQ